MTVLVRTLDCMSTLTIGGPEAGLNALQQLFAFAGLVGAPLFVVVFTAEGARRCGYDWLRQPISTLALGSAGWVQRANFVVTGLLLLGPAVALWSAPGGRWVGLLLGGFALGLVGAGAFTTDAVGGYPPDTPPPPQPSVAGGLHLVISFLAVGFLTAACFVAAARLAAEGDAGRAVLSGVTGGVVRCALRAVRDRDGLPGGAGPDPRTDRAGLRCHWVGVGRRGLARALAGDTPLTSSMPVQRPAADAVPEALTRLPRVRRLSRPPGAPASAPRTS